VGPRAGLATVSKRKIPNPRRESNPDHPIVRPIAWFIFSQCNVALSNDAEGFCLPLQVFPSHCGFGSLSLS
jgi:hypothetical protein